jgi:hypothetical protein
MTCTDTDARTSARTGEDAGGALITRRSRVQIPPPPPCAQVRPPWPAATRVDGVRRWAKSPCQRPSDREGLAACQPFVTRSR